LRLGALIDGGFLICPHRLWITLLKSRWFCSWKAVNTAIFWLARFPRVRLYLKKIKHLCDVCANHSVLRREKNQPRQLCA